MSLNKGAVQSEGLSKGSIQQTVSSNVVPIASAVAIIGTTKVGQTLTGNYTYSDTEGDIEGASTFRWLRDDVAIGGETSQTLVLTITDLTTIIKFEVTPVALSGDSPGLAVQSIGVGPITAASTINNTSYYLIEPDQLLIL